MSPEQSRSPAYSPRRRGQDSRETTGSSLRTTGQLVWDRLRYERRVACHALHYRERAFFPDAFALVETLPYAARSVLQCSALIPIALGHRCSVLAAIAHRR